MPICEPGRFGPSSNRQSPRLPRHGLESARAAHRGPYLFHNVRVLSPSYPINLTVKFPLFFLLFLFSQNSVLGPGIVRYWLPDLLEHEYIALRFLAQASYEQAAKMRVSPAPDVVARVFMLFRGVAPGDVGLWEQAAARVTAENGATFWTNVVGIDSARASDPSLFRVLEWGGMEVK